MNSLEPRVATGAVLVESGEVDKDAEVVRGYDFSGKSVDYERLLGSYATTGFQATNFSRAVKEIKRMLDWRLADEPLAEGEEPGEDELRKNTKCTIFLGYTSNLISSGIRESLLFLVKHKLVDCIVSTAGGIEEDLIKCLGHTYIGRFDAKGAELRENGMNRIGNLFVPNNNYCLFEDWIHPILDSMLVEQNRDNVRWTPSSMIHRLGKEINNPESVYYWCEKNDIPVFCPALTDGSIGDMLYFHSYRNPGLSLDIVSDIRKINDIAVHSKKSGMIILGGGLIKHHINNANLMRGGADFAVYVNTAAEFDGSDAGARPDEAVSWGKIRIEAKPVKVYSEVSLVFPLMVASTFFHYVGQDGFRK